MILSGGGQDMVRPSGGGGGGGLNRLWDIISRNQNMAQITHSVDETTRGIKERHANATDSLVNLMHLSTLKHPDGHPQAGELVHPMLAHHIEKAGLQSAYGFKFGSQYKPFENPPVEANKTQPTPTPTPTPKKNRKRK